MIRQLVDEALASLEAGFAALLPDGNFAVDGTLVTGWAVARQWFKHTAGRPEEELPAEGGRQAVR